MSENDIVVAQCGTINIQVFLKVSEYTVFINYATPYYSTFTNTTRAGVILRDALPGWCHDDATLIRAINSYRNRPSIRLSGRYVGVDARA